MCVSVSVRTTLLSQISKVPLALCKMRFGAIILMFIGMRSPSNTYDIICCRASRWDRTCYCTLQMVFVLDGNAGLHAIKFVAITGV